MNMTKYLNVSKINESASSHDHLDDTSLEMVENFETHPRIPKIFSK